MSKTTVTTVNVRDGGSMLRAGSVFVALCFIGLAFGSVDDSTSSSSTSSSSSKSTSSSSGRTVSSEQAYQIIKGCCEGVGGTYSSQGQDCVMYENQSAYQGCVGTLKVEFHSGNTRTVTGQYRP